MKHLIKKLLREGLEEVTINSKGELQDFNCELYYYDYQKVLGFIKEYEDEYGENYEVVQGWTIFHNEPREQHCLYITDMICEIQAIDEPDQWSKESGVGYVDKLEKDDTQWSDEKAWMLARKIGFMVDDDGVIYGWKGRTCLTER